MTNMERLYAVIVLALFASATAQNPASELFVGMQPLEDVAYEVLSNPMDVMSPMISASINELEPEGVGYRFFYSEGVAPSILYDDVCPSGFEAVWYTIEASDDEPVNFDFQGEVNPSEEGMEGGFFFSYFPDVEPMAETPVYIATCAYSDRREMVYRSNNLNATPAVVNLSKVISMRCEVSITNSGNRKVLAEQTLDNLTFCYAEQELE